VLQCAPYKFFGCDLVNYFKGTLFRFPLRNATTARASAIINTPQTRADISNLLDKFQQAIHQTLLFVRNVRRIEVYELDDTDGTAAFQFFGEGLMDDISVCDRYYGGFVHIELKKRARKGLVHPQA
jgi:hypothetical protein